MSDICVICKQRCYVECVGMDHYRAIQADNAAKDERIKELKIKLAGSYMHNLNIEALLIANELPIPSKGLVTFLPDCIHRRDCGTCYNLGSINRGGPCSKRCTCPEKAEGISKEDK